MAKKLVFLVTDPTVFQQTERLTMHLKDFATTTSQGFRADVLDNVCILMDFLIETLPRLPDLRDLLVLLLENMNRPILLNVVSDVVKYFASIQNYIGFMGYLLMRLEDDHLFDLVSNAIIWQLAAPDALRGPGAAQRRYTTAAAGPVLQQTVSRMLAVTTAHRIPTFQTIALLLACYSLENCIELMKENIIENILYRFNPYFPEKKLPRYDNDPADPQDCNVKIGDSSVNISTTLSLMLVLLKTTKQYLEENPKHRLLLPCPDAYSQRCFVWAFRFECRARAHQHERTTLVVIATALLHCFGNRMSAFSALLMPDIMSLSVLTEMPPRADWTNSVNFSTAQPDVLFKKTLIYFSVDLLKTFPCNKRMVETRHWLVGLMYLIDPGLCYLRARWSPSLFSELRKTTLQALVCTLPLTEPNLAKEYGLVRRVMWYIEWYSESPYELGILYWCLRLLQVAAYHRGEPARNAAMKDLFNTHGVVILIHLCYTLLEQKTPPVEKGQAILGLALRLLTSAVERPSRVSCCVYPDIKWPHAVTSLARHMMDSAIYSLEKHCIVNDRWLIALLNFVWEAIIWKTEFREKFIIKDGIYKLLDIITMSRAPVQCIAMAIICDATRSGDAVGQLVTWRANLGASNAHPSLVKRGATIATLLAAIFRDECKVTGIRLDHNGVLIDLDSPIMSSEVRRELRLARPTSQRTAVCFSAADITGSRLSKAFGILHMLSEDLDYKVSLADEAYNLYKNIKLAPEDEVVLVLCSYYLTLKQCEVWSELQTQSEGFLPHDEATFQEFLHLGRGWAKEVKQMQEKVIEQDRIKERDEEYSLYSFLDRVRLNVALDALRQVRCLARSADRARITHALLQDAVRAHHRRSAFAKRMNAPVLRTYGPTLDDHNITGQNVKVYSIHPKDKPKPREDIPAS